jgi:hypothetical protein
MTRHGAGDIRLTAEDSSIIASHQAYFSASTGWARFNLQHVYSVRLLEIKK